MASQSITLDDLRAQLDHAKERIAREKQSILKLNPLPDDFNREEYAFAYMRAERLGLRAINHKLRETAWLPMQLDASAEIMGAEPKSMKRWLTSAIHTKPDAEDFGNDFIHALARCGMKFGWEDSEVTRFAARIAALFHDLSCFVGIIFYCSWLSENHISSVEISNPQNLGRSVVEIAALVESPQLMRRWLAQDPDNARTAAEARNRRPNPPMPPILQVIRNDAYNDPPRPDPARV